MRSSVAMHNHVSMPQATEIIGADEASDILGIDRSTLTRWVTAEKVTPLQKLPGEKGAYLFRRAHIEKLAAERTARRAS